AGFGPNDSDGWGINQDGWITGQVNSSTVGVVGFLLPPAPATHLFLLRTLGPTIPGLQFPPDSNNTLATGINQGRWVAGRSPDSFGDDHAVRWSPAGEITDLGTLPGGGGSIAYGISEAGWVFGTSSIYSPIGQGAQHGFRVPPAPATTMEDLGDYL